MRDVEVQTGDLEGDQRVAFDAEEWTITIDVGPMSSEELIDVARMATFAASAIIPGVSLNPDQAEQIAKVVLKISDYVRRSNAGDPEV